MRQQKRQLIWFGLICSWLWPALPVAAASPNFKVQPEIATTQLSPQANYYHVLLANGQSQKLKFRILNLTRGTRHYRVAVNRATTSASGILSYSQHAPAKPESLSIDIEKLAPKPQTVTVAPQSAKTVTLTLKAPSTAFPGILLGGIEVTDRDDISTAKVAYVTAIKAQATPTLPAIAPRLQLNNAYAQAAETGVQVYAKFENPQPAIQAQTAITARLFRSGHKRAVLTKKMAAVTLAPNSHFTLPVNVAPKRLAAGNYRIAVTAVAADHTTWHFTKSVRISSAMLKDAKPTTPAVAPSFPLWAGIGLGGLALVLAGGSYYLWRRR
ncbi:MAG: DUF916 and DUF3324 domain-containing protein [Lactobacillus sp.]|jgi:hypothetical protein|nr:DUF916 and DUF3324 domain-containing protein [Lactobacillus sp.]MCI2034289.1 DUF916 and DUF3324 domain-containing protein [Lactobacillus sp.]